MAAAIAGRVLNVHTLGEAYCNLIIACTAAGDWERPSEWYRYVDEFAEERKIGVLFGACRTVHADVLVARGQWSEAEAALADALDAHRRDYPVMAAPTVSALALLRIRQGRLAEAEQLLAGREEQLTSLLALAELRLDEAEPPTAVVLLERALSGTIALVNWTPEGQVGEMFRIMGRYLPAPPSYALWGSEEHVRKLFRRSRRDLFRTRDGAVAV
jgi:hypothetical protein